MYAARQARALLAFPGSPWTYAVRQHCSQKRTRCACSAAAGQVSVQRVYQQIIAENSLHTIEKA